MQCVVLGLFVILIFSILVLRAGFGSDCPSLFVAYINIHDITNNLHIGSNKVKRHRNLHQQHDNRLGRVSNELLGGGGGA